LLAILLFTLLALTGLPQKFYQLEWAGVLLKFFGGLDQLRGLHRLFGLIFGLHLAIHLLNIVLEVLRDHIRMTLLPTRQDIVDLFATISYYLGYRKEPPLYPKFDYRQKFEYLAILLGSTVMALSGLILFFGPQVIQKFSGIWILVARETHSTQAVLALFLIIIWHLYGAHLSPEVFPGNASILHGYISKDELKKHHGAEYERLFGKIEAAEVEPTKSQNGEAS
jgi:cytochrome b subunit of formate dehydrogenase